MPMMLKAVQAPLLMPQVWQRSKELGRERETLSEPGKKKEKPLRGDGGSDSTATYNREYRRVMKQSYSHQKQIPVFSVLFKSCLCCVCLSERLISSWSFTLTPPVSVRTHWETWHPNRGRVRGDGKSSKKQRKGKQKRPVKLFLQPALWPLKSNVLGKKVKKEGERDRRHKWHRDGRQHKDTEIPRPLVFTFCGFSFNFPMPLCAFNFLLRSIFLSALSLLLLP